MLASRSLRCIAPLARIQRFTAFTSLPRFYSSQRLTLPAVQDRVLNVVKGFEKVDAAKVTLDSHFINDLGLDSLDQVDLTMAIEEEFSIEIPDADAENILTPRQASDKRSSSLSSGHQQPSGLEAMENLKEDVVLHASEADSKAMGDAISKDLSVDLVNPIVSQTITKDAIPETLTKDVSLEAGTPTFEAASPEQGDAAVGKRNWRSGKVFITTIVTLGVIIDLLSSINFKVMPTLVLEFGGSETDVGVLLAVYGAGIVIFSPIMGVVSDRWKNRKVPMAASLALLLGATMFFAFAKSYWALVIGRFLQGAASTGVWVLGLALIADVHRDDDAGLGKAMGFVVGGYTLGQLIGPPIGGALYQQNRYSPYILCCGLILIDVVGRMLVVDPPTAPEELNEDGTPKKRMGFWGLAKLCPAVLGFTFLVAMVFTGFEPTLPLFLEQKYGFDTAKIGLTFLALIVPSMIAGPFAGMAYDKYGSTWVMVPSLFISAIILYTLCIGEPLAWLIIGLFLVGLLFTFNLTPQLPDIAVSVPKTEYAKAYSLFNMAFSCAIFVGPSASAALYEKHGWFWEMIFLASATLLTAILSLFYKGPKQAKHHADAVVVSPTDTNSP
ncbi:hypothetical protein HDU97_005064 [Phlyctochytrium planicorne]|nr:hypothetical protein HDU97_005064 [Phlyctochytrium planicorne]